MEPSIRCLWSQFLLSAHSPCNFHLLSFSDQSSERCALQDACHSAWMNCIGQDPTSSKGEWRQCERAVPFPVSLTLPDSLLWYYPRPNWSYLPSALPISAKTTRWASSCLLQSLTRKREAHRDSGYPPEQRKKLPKVSMPVTLLQKLFWKNKVYSSLPIVCHQRTWPIQTGADLHGKQPQKS